MSNTLAKILLVFILLCTTSSFAQSIFKYVPTDTIEVIKNGITLGQPWAGGMNNPNFSQLDVNFDCLPDLVVFERLGNNIKVYLNVGDSLTPDYRYAPSYERFFPLDLFDIVIVNDFNGDGLKDIVTHQGPGTSGVKVYKNISDSTLKFELYAAQLEATNQGFPWQPYMGIGNYSVFDDVDGDGKVDFLGYPVGASTIEYYRNASNSPDSIGLEYETGCWGRFFESADTVRIQIPCKRSSGSPNQRHAGGLIKLYDFNQDGLKDVLFTDPGDPDIKMLMNGGDSNTAEMTSVTYDFPTNSVPVHIEGSPVASFLKVNDLEHVSMLVAPHDQLNSEDTANVWLYEMSTTSSGTDFTFVTNKFLVQEQIDVGTQALPYFYDIDGDGLEDLLISNKGYFDSLSIPQGSIVPMAYYTSRVSYYRNIGAIGAPKFELVTDDYLNLSAKKYSKLNLAFGDLNGDGVDDLLILNADGYLSYYENNGIQGGPVNFVWATDSLGGTDIRTRAAMVLYDLNSDGLLDMIIGRHNGNLEAYYNIGSTSGPLFGSVSVSNFGGITVPFNYGTSVFEMGMTVANFNNYGDLLVIGDPSGNIRFYDGLSVAGGSLTMIDSLKLTRSTLAPAFAALDSSGNKVMVVGELAGGVQMLHIDTTTFGSSPYPIQVCIPDTSPSNPGDTLGVNDLFGDKNFELYPNPTSGEFKVVFNTLENQQVTINLLDLGGRSLYSESLVVSGYQELILSSTLLPKGMVLVEVDTQQGKFYKRLIVQ